MDLFSDLPTPAGKKISTGGDSDDLFGGLPAAASAAGGEKKKELVDDEKKSSPTDDAKTAAAPPHGKSSTATSNKRKSTSASLVSAVGKAGTSFAFVPHAISQARKKKKIITQPPRPKVALNKMNPEAMHQPLSNAKENKIKAVAGEKESKDHESKQVTTTVEQSTTTQPVQQHEHKIIAKTDNDEQSFEEPYPENEPESIRLLHESVTPENAYNPHFPNDYLAHIERKKTERIQKELQQSALQRLDQQEKLRKKIEEERRKIERSGDVDKIVEMRSGLGGATANKNNGVGGAGRGRGRGRGVQNLPAWLIKKQEKLNNTAVTLGQFGDAEGGKN